MALLEMSGYSKYYGEADSRICVLDDVNLQISEGEFVAILGYSGSGKTTLISALAGLIQGDSGGVIYEGIEVTEPDPERALVFQSYSLMPWLSVAGNIRLAVDTVHRKKSAKERLALIEKYIDMVGLMPAKDRKPAELSGGMRQRVAVARALAMQPRVLLLDEPLSALDALTRAKLQDELAEISARERSTIVLITNDVDEAILLADRVIPLTQAPSARLEKEFVIDLPKPRNRTSLNSDPRFAELRADITRYLMNMNDEQTQTTGRTMPDVVPVSFDKRPPAKYIEAAQTHKEQRYLEFSQVDKTYPTPEGPLTVVEDFQLTMNKGEFVTLIGHSGCGKSTVLSMTAGLNEITAGGIILDGKHITNAGPDRAVVFQAPSLMPWLTAFDNVMLGAERVYPKASRGERRDVVEYYLERVGLADTMYRPVSDFSNGMKQRVGIARAFALSPKLLLLDEPFGMLDSLTRWTLQDVLMDVWSRTKVTAICVTHDVDEAILLADRVVMMSNGPNARVGNIMDVDLERPRTRDELLSHPDYYAYREELLCFLEAYEGGANPDPDQLDGIKHQRELRLKRNRGSGNAITETAKAPTAQLPSSSTTQSTQPVSESAA